MEIHFYDIVCLYFDVFIRFKVIVQELALI